MPRMNRIIAILSLSFSILIPASGQAQPVPTLDGRFLYHFAWGGLSIGTMTVEIHETQDRYSMRTEVAASGLVKMFNKHVSHTKVSGTATAKNYQPENYESLYQTKKKKKHVTLRYDVSGTLLDERSLPLDTSDDRTAITKEQKNNAIDPLTILLQGRKQAALAESSGNSELHFKLYDGTRLADGTLKRGDTNRITIGGKQVDVAHWIASRQPIGGYTAKDLEKMKKGEPPLHIYFAKDGSMLPLRIELPLPMGMVTGYLVGECSKVACDAEPDWAALQTQWETVLGK